MSYHHREAGTGLDPMYMSVLLWDIANVRAMSTSFHLLGFHRHCRSALTAEESSSEAPVDLSTVTSVTAPQVVNNP
jgi:hypothetical protein